MKFKSEVKFKSVPLFLFLCFSLSNRLAVSESVAPYTMEGQSTTYYVKPSSSNSCPTEPCFTLQQLANNINKFINSSTELIFLPGNHDLDLELSIIGINTVSMHSNITNSVSGDMVVINCNHSGKFKFERVHAVSMISLTFIECNGSKAMYVHQFVIEDTSFIGGAALEFIQTSAMLVRSTFYCNSGKKSHYVMNLHNHSQVGGAIVATVRSNITVLESIFEENSAKLGGAIFSDLGSDIIIINTSFSGNSIKYYDIGYDLYMQGLYWYRGCKGGGGVLYGDSGVTITIQDSQFINNTAQGDMCGGVVFIISNEVDHTAKGDMCGEVMYISCNQNAIDPLLAINSTLTIESSQFINNSAQMSGGAIYAQSYVNITIINSYFKGMKSQEEGEIIRAYDNAIISIAKSRFINIIAHKRDPKLATAGAFSIERNVKITFIFCRFINNSLVDTYDYLGRNGIVYAKYRVTITITNCYFFNNIGGIIIGDSEVRITITHSQFINNRASGIVSIESNSHLKIAHSVFTDNSTPRVISNNPNYFEMCYRDNTTYDCGGVVYAYNNVNIILAHSYFRVNRSASGDIENGGPGVVYGRDGIYLTITYCQFINNVAQYRGGALSLYGRYKWVHLLIIGSKFSGNRAREGGSICLIGGSLVIQNSSFDYNKANRDGGALYLDNTTVTVRVTETVFSNNRANRDGGIMFLRPQEEHYQFRNKIFNANCSFFTNSAGGNGGLFYVNGDFHLSGSLCENNTADNDGGVLYTTDHKSSIKISESNFQYNNAMNDGGIVYAQQSSTITLLRSSFHGNNAMNDGGVIYMRQNDASITKWLFDENNGGAYRGSLNISEDSIFIDNMAYNDGGVIHAYHLNMIVTGNRYDYNKAWNRGGVWFINQGQITVTQSIVSHNMADKDGGVLHLIESNITISENKFQNNYATNDGGVLHLHQSNIILSRSFFDSNNARKDGGILFMNQRSKSIISECKLENNYAKNDGGVVYAHQSTITLSKLSFDNSFAANDGGVFYMRQTNASITECSFDGNIAINNGGVINAYQGNLSINEDSIFINNMAYNDGGVIHAYQISMIVTGNRYDCNKALNRGGVWFIYQGQITVIQSIVSHSEAAYSGVMYAYQGNITMSNVSCLRNNAREKGMIHTDHISNVSVTFSSFSLNYVKKAKGGAWYMKHTQALFQEVSFFDNDASSGVALYSSCCNISLINATFEQNEADSDGGAMYMKTTNLNSSGSLLIRSNRAKFGTIYLFRSTAYFTGQAGILNNSGSFLILQSNVTFLGNISFINGSELMEPKFNIGVMELYNIRAKVQQGGALTIIKSSITFGGTCIITDNHADNGGAIHATESKIYVNGEIAIARNKAKSNGGGVYLHTSELFCERNGSLQLSNNFANESGGGIHAIGSTISVNRDKSTPESDRFRITNIKGCSLCFNDNHAEKGGGLYLDEKAKIHLYTDNFRSSIHSFSFINNLANYGGGMYISDNPCGYIYNYQYITNRLSGLCFIQVPAHCNSCSKLSNITIERSMIFFLENNYALTSGSSLFGEMLYQCKIPQLDNQTCDRSNEIVNTISFIKSISNIELSDLGTEPYQLCFCQGRKFDCSFEHNEIRVRKGKRFSIELVAIDRVNHPVNATIHSLLARTGGGLGGDQEYQNTNKICTELIYNIFSPNDKEELILYLEKDCITSDSILPQRRLTIKFTACDSCPIGFEKHVEDGTSCECVCDSKLKHYIESCNASTEMLQRKGNVWISYLNTGDNSTSGYLIYPYCLLNYCLPPTSKVEINLNIPHGADMQCADGHSGILCGTCQKNLSLSLGSSRCIPCGTHWPKILAILLGIPLAGIALVTLLLMLNFTVAIGTFNGILFYVNIVAANGSIHIPFSTPNFATIFISWLNLEIGFDACLLEGMNPFWKTLLQLAFPTYVIFLVIMIIIISEYSSKFARLLTKKSPVATLATLILLSYTKYLNTIITIFSYNVLEYPDGSHRKLWRPDATVEYLSGKHIILFIIATLILIIGIAYTSLLFSWQWLLCYQNKKFLIWTRYQKLCHFIELYHVPYNVRHCYWTGLLLFARVLLYIISAVNITGDPQMPLVMTIILITTLLLIGRLWADMLYKNRLLEVMEMIMYVNITALASLTLWNIDDTSNNQTIVVYISITVTFVLTMTVIIFHVFYYTRLVSIIKSIALKFKTARHQVEDDIISNQEIQYHQPLITHSVIELPKPAVYQASEEENELYVSTRSDDITAASDTAREQCPVDQEL